MALTFRLYIHIIRPVVHCGSQGSVIEAGDRIQEMARVVNDRGHDTMFTLEVSRLDLQDYR
jgi:hypothetical protein